MIDVIEMCMTRLWRTGTRVNENNIIRGGFMKSFRYFRGRYLLLLMCSPGAMAASAAAQVPHAAGQQQDEVTQSGSIGEIIVTARRRAEPLQKVPVAVQVVSGDQLERSNSNTLENIGQDIPGVQLLNTGNTGNSLNIRGIGSGSENPAFEQSVATFVDDTYIGRGKMLSSTFMDLERIEVLKGPQTTYFGNNAISGALNIITKIPDFESGGRARVLYGSYGAFAAEAAVNIPLSDRLAVRIAGLANGQNGWVRNIVDGEKGPRERNYVGRISARFAASDELDFLLKLERGRNKFENASGGMPGQWSLCPWPGTYPINRYCGLAIARGVPLGFDNKLNAVVPGEMARLNTGFNSLKISYTTDAFEVSSLTAYNTYSSRLNVDNAHIGVPPVHTLSVDPEKYRQFSQELRISSPADRSFSYLVGGYYQYARTNFEAFIHAAFLDPVIASRVSPDVLPLLSFPFGFNLGYEQREHVVSGFGAIQFAANDKLKFDAGLRWTRVSKKIVGHLAYGHASRPYGGFIPAPAAGQDALSFILGAPGDYFYKVTDDALMGTAGLRYEFSPSVMAYAKYSRGFKAGGYNAIAVAPIRGTDIPPTFGPEFVNAYEVGFKSKFLENRILLNISAFRQEYSDLQVNALVTLPTNNATAVRNAAEAVSQGVELETQWQATPSLKLGVNATYLDAYYSRYPDGPPTFEQRANGAERQDLSGKRTDFAPEWSGLVRLEHVATLPGDLRLTTDLSAILKSSYYYSNSTNDPNFLIDDSGKIDAKFTIEPSRGPWAFDLIVKNLTDAVLPISFGTNSSVGGRQPPRTFAAQLRVTW